MLYCISHQSAVEVPYILIRELASTVTGLVLDATKSLFFKDQENAKDI